ncbi:hypothetical protein AWB65_06010 [Caballeronia humi]|uniref:Uncharacterized protein n=1 Tax=Caballeronia humi TaxID=326474 RepID=A0A158J5S4_9BURK|nr:hypothetical protein AWB65_06010 [Caballeronia humi]
MHGHGGLAGPAPGEHCVRDNDGHFKRPALDGEREQ